MIEKVKLEIYTHEGLQHDQQSDFYEVVLKILVSRWAKSNTPLHCLAHSLNPRFYSDAWLHEDPDRVSPHRDAEVSEGRIKCFRKLFPEPQDFKHAMEELGCFLSSQDHIRVERTYIVEAPWILYSGWQVLVHLLLLYKHWL